MSITKNIEYICICIAFLELLQSIHSCYLHLNRFAQSTSGKLYIIIIQRTKKIENVLFVY